MEIYYFTYTGLSEKIAKIIANKLKIEVKKITTYRLPYIGWLFLSFLPFLPVKAFFSPPSGREIILCFPKWTFNCPPVTYFLKKIRCEKLILIISYGGWREKEYAQKYKKLGLKVAKKVEVFLVKRKKWKEDLKKVMNCLGL